MNAKDVLTEKDLPEKASATKSFGYYSSSKELKKQNSVAEKQYQKLSNAFKSNKKKEDKTKNRRSRAKSIFFDNDYFTFYKYRNIKEFAKHSFGSKQNYLIKFNDKLELFYHDTEEI